MAHYRHHRARDVGAAGGVIGATEVATNKPNFQETGLEPVNRMAYYSLLVPKGTSKEVIDKLCGMPQARKCWKILRCASVSKTLGCTSSASRLISLRSRSRTSSRCTSTLWPSRN